MWRYLNHNAKEAVKLEPMIFPGFDKRSRRGRKTGYNESKKLKGLPL
jgi:hypothetical protein